MIEWEGGALMSVLYVDLSHHDWDRTKGELDWARIRAATSPVMCARATYGDPAGYNPTSRHFGDMARGARAAGIDVIGGYHNLVRGDQVSINRQVDYLRRTLDGAGASWAMLDVERYEELVANGLWPRFDDVRQFVDRWHAVDKRVLTVYLPRWIWDGHLGRPDMRVLDAPLVASNYGSNPNGTPSAVYSARGGDGGPGWTPYGGVTPTIWQYGSNVDCPGASGQTDCNAYRGTLAQLRALLTTGQEDDMPTADEIAEAVAKKLVTRDIWPNGYGDKETNPTIALGTFVKNAGADTSGAMKATGRIETQLATLRSELGAMVGRDFTDEAAIVQGVLAGLGGQPTADVARALVAAGQNPAELAAELSKLAAGQS